MTREEQFEQFWKMYPRRISKGAARKAFEKAIKLTTLETMRIAIAEYVAKKPERIDFKHPATWLNQECWCDEWPSTPFKVPAARPDDMTTFMMTRMESRHATTIDAEYARGGNREQAFRALEDTTASRRH